MAFSNFVRQAVVALSICLFFSPGLFAQKSNRVDNLSKSDKVIVNGFDWHFEEDKATTQAEIIISNKASIEIKTVSIALTGQDKDKVMLQSGGTHTLEQETKEESIAAGGTKTIVFEKAFSNPRVATIKLKKVVVEYVNGSIETLNDM